MNFDIRTTDDLVKVLKYIKEEAKKPLENTGNEVAERVKREIDNVVYSVTDGEGSKPENSYERTYDLRNSMQSYPLKETDDVLEVELKHNIEKIRAVPEKFQHASPYWSPWNYSQFLARTVHDGLSGGLFGYGYWCEPRPYMDNVKDDMKNGEYKNIMMSELRKKGFVVE